MHIAVLLFVVTKTQGTGHLLASPVRPMTSQAPTQKKKLKASFILVRSKNSLEGLDSESLVMIGGMLKCVCC